jgi:hypothetical protein
LVFVIGKKFVEKVLNGDMYLSPSTGIISAMVFCDDPEKAYDIPADIDPH